MKPPPQGGSNHESGSIISTKLNNQLKTIWFAYAIMGATGPEVTLYTRTMRHVKVQIGQLCREMIASTGGSKNIWTMYFSNIMFPDVDIWMKNKLKNWGFNSAKLNPAQRKIESNSAKLNPTQRKTESNSVESNPQNWMT